MNCVIRIPAKYSCMDSDLQLMGRKLGNEYFVKAGAQLTRCRKYRRMPRDSDGALFLFRSRSMVRWIRVFFSPWIAQWAMSYWINA